MDVNRLFPGVVTSVRKIGRCRRSFFFCFFCRNIDDTADSMSAVNGRCRSAEYFDAFDIIDRNVIQIHRAVVGAVHLDAVDKNKNIRRIKTAQIDFAAVALPVDVKTGHLTDGITDGPDIFLFHVFRRDNADARRHLLDFFHRSCRRDNDLIKGINGHFCSVNPSHTGYACHEHAEHAGF